MNAQRQAAANGERKNTRHVAGKALARRGGASFSPSDVLKTRADAVIVLVPADGSRGDGQLDRIHRQVDMLADRWNDAKQRPDNGTAKILAQITGEVPPVVYAGYDPSLMMSGADAMVRAARFVAANKWESASITDPTVAGVPATLAEAALQRMRAEHGIATTVHGS